MRARFGLCVVAIVVFQSTGLNVARADEKPKTESAGNISLIVENDLVVRTDRDYTSGVKASWITAPENTPLWAKAFATQIPLFSNWSTVRTEYALQQVIFTPQRTTLVTPDPRDRPYAGWLNASFALLGENGPLLDQLAVSVGVVGPASLAQESQKLIHDLYRQPSPNGWAHQLRNEPTLQLRYQRSWRALAAYSFDGDYGLDVTPHAGFMLGNVYTFANAGITFRLGKDLQQDFGPPRIGPNVSGSGYFVPRKTLGWYLFAGLEARAMARNIFLDGSTFEASPHVSKRPFVGDLQAGFAVTLDQIRLSYTQVWRTKEFYGQSRADQFGALTLSVRW